MSTCGSGAAGIPKGYRSTELVRSVFSDALKMRYPHNRMRMVLNDSELRSITGKKRRSAQRRVLTALGIEYKLRPDGSLVVLTSHVENVLGRPDHKKNAMRSDEPNWKALAPRST